MQLLLNEAIYKKVIVELLSQTRKFLWIITADIKDLHVPKGRRFVPTLEILGVECFRPLAGGVIPKNQAMEQEHLLETVMDSFPAKRAIIQPRQSQWKAPLRLRSWPQLW